MNIWKSEHVYPYPCLLPSITLRPFPSASYGTTAASAPTSFFKDGGDVQEKSPPDTYRASVPVPCVTYWMGETLYLAITNRCNTVPLHTTRGPGFKLADRLSKAGFLPLEYDPSAEVNKE